MQDYLEEQPKKPSETDLKPLAFIAEDKLLAPPGKIEQNSLKTSTNIAQIIANDNNLVNRPQIPDNRNIFSKRTKHNEDPHLKQYKQTLGKTALQDKEKPANLEIKESFLSFLKPGFENKLKILEAEEKRELQNDLNKKAHSSQFFETHFEKKRTEKKLICEFENKKKSFKKQPIKAHSINERPLLTPHVNFTNSSVSSNINSNHNDITNHNNNDKNNEKIKNILNFKKKSLIHNNNNAETREKKPSNIKTNTENSMVNHPEKQEKTKLLPIPRNIKENNNNILVEQQRIKTKTPQIVASSSNILELFPQDFFLPDYNYINTNQFVDISNLASRKNTNELFLHLLNSKSEADPLIVDRVPNSFDSPATYLSIFKTLFLNEATARLVNLLKDFSKPSKQNFNLSPYRIKLVFDPKTDSSDFTYFEIGDAKNEKKSENFESESLKKNELESCFDIKFAKNYIVFITNCKDIRIELLRDESFSNKEHFLILGIVLNEKTNTNEPLKIITRLQRENFLKYLKNSKNEWLEINIMPLEKITTFIREYIGIQNLQYEEISKRIYNPKMTLFTNSEDNMNVMNKFFVNTQKQFNDSQYSAIKEICSIKEGISLLQGPPGTGKTFALIGIVSGLYHYIKNSSQIYKRHLMICAPSNAAIDEIIIRIKKKGLIDENGNCVRPQLLRIGVLDQNPSEIVKNVSLEHKAQEILLNQEKISMEKEKSTAVEIRQMIEKVGAKIEKIKKEADDINNKEIKKLLDYLFDKRRRLNYDYLQIKQNKISYKEKYKQIVDNLLNQAEIICCTLSSAGSDKMEFFKNKIEALIVDEASQCTEPTNIIPLQLSINKVVLIGDPKQLPATTFSPDSNKTLYNRSLFERFIDNGITPYFLDEQYRMHRNIREFPSMMFYSNRLKDGDSIKSRKFPIYLSNFETKNVFFLDLEFAREKLIDYSYLNEHEAMLALKICKFLIKKNSNLSDQSFFSRIGFITPYKRQVNYFREIYKKEISNKYHQIQINTVDSFQGQEKDIIIFSTVRSTREIRERNNLIGFLDDTRRMNVALTRAKFVLIVIGNGDTLSSNEIWNQLLNHMIKKGNYYTINNAENMDNFVEIMFRNTNEIPNIYKKINLIHHIRTLKKAKISEHAAKITLFEENFAKKKLKHNLVKKTENDNNNSVIFEEETNKVDEEKQGWKSKKDDILIQEDHSYLFNKNEKISNLMCLISNSDEIMEELPPSSSFNLLNIAKSITK